MTYAIQMYGKKGIFPHFGALDHQSDTVLFQICIEVNLSLSLSLSDTLHFYHIYCYTNLAEAGEVLHEGLLADGALERADKDVLLWRQDFQILFYFGGTNLPWRGRKCGFLG